MSQHSSNASSTTTSAATTPTAAAVTLEEVPKAKSASSSSSLFGSLKKQKNKDTEREREVPTLTDDFVLMSTPEKFKDKNLNETQVVKRHRLDSVRGEKVKLDCLLLADTSVPSGAPVHVETLLNHFGNTHPSQGEILFLLVYTVALESGYVALSDYEETKFELDNLTATSSFNGKNILRVSHLKPNYLKSADQTRFTLKLRTLVDVDYEDQNELLYSLLTGFVTGDFLIVTLTPATSTNAQGFSTTLSIARYVLSMQAKNKPLHQRFHKLEELSYLLRDQLFVPMRCQQLEWLECVIYPSLDGLPVELYDHILKYLNKNQLNILANVNKSLNNLIVGSKFMPKSNESLRSNLK